jgi:sortase A
VLIATGLLMFGFVAYQLWGTGLEYAQSQDRLEDDFAALLATGPSSTPEATSAASTTVALAPTTLEPSGTPATNGAAPSTVPATTTPPSAAPPVAAPLPAPGDVIALIEIPSIDLETYVVSGVQPADLKKGPGHYPDTPQPGQLGNSAIAGHRTTYGQPFFELDKVAAGDEIVITTVQGRFVYRTTGSEVVTPDRGDVVATTDPSVGRLTLTTCDPKYTARNRLVLYADFDVGASSGPPQASVVQTPAPAASASPPTTGLPAGTDDPVVSAPSTTAPTGSTVTSTGATTATTTATTTTDAAGPPAGSDEELADAFAHGWFSDDAAFPQVALWGVVVSLIALAAWTLSRRVRRDWVGALVGIVPFLLALYFFFQNVNRLLPAAL